MKYSQQLPIELQNLIQEEDSLKLDLFGQHINQTQESGNDMPDSLTGRMEQNRTMDFCFNEAPVTMNQTPGSTSYLRHTSQGTTDDGDFCFTKDHSSFKINENKNNMSTPNFMIETPTFNDFFEEEQNTKKKTTKKTTTRTTTNGNAETHEKIEETVTEETVTVIKRPISSFNLESHAPIITDKKVPLIQLDVPSGSKTSNIPYGVPFKDERVQNKSTRPKIDKNIISEKLAHERSVSSYEDTTDGLLTKIKEEDENADDSSSASRSKESCRVKSQSGIELSKPNIQDQLLSKVSLTKQEPEKVQSKLSSSTIQLEQLFTPRAVKINETETPQKKTRTQHNTKSPFLNKLKSINKMMTHFHSPQLTNLNEFKQSSANYSSILDDSKLNEIINAGQSYRKELNQKTNQTMNNYLQKYNKKFRYSKQEEASPESNLLNSSLNFSSNNLQNGANYSPGQKEISKSSLRNWFTSQNVNSNIFKKMKIKGSAQKHQTQLNNSNEAFSQNTIQTQSYQNVNTSNNYIQNLKTYLQRNSLMEEATQKFDNPQEQLNSSLNLMQSRTVSQFTSEPNSNQRYLSPNTSTVVKQQNSTKKSRISYFSPNNIMTNFSKKSSKSSKNHHFTSPKQQIKDSMQNQNYPKNQSKQTEANLDLDRNSQMTTNTLNSKATYYQWVDLTHKTGDGKIVVSKQLQKQKTGLETSYQDAGVKGKIKSHNSHSQNLQSQKDKLLLQLKGHSPKKLQNTSSQQKEDDGKTVISASQSLFTQYFNKEKKQQHKIQNSPNEYTSKFDQEGFQFKTCQAPDNTARISNQVQNQFEDMKSRSVSKNNLTRKVTRDFLEEMHSQQFCSHQSQPNGRKKLFKHHSTVGKAEFNQSNSVIENTSSQRFRYISPTRVSGQINANLNSSSNTKRHLYISPKLEKSIQIIKKDNQVSRSKKNFMTSIDNLKTANSSNFKISENVFGTVTDRQAPGIYNSSQVSQISLNDNLSDLQGLKTPRSFANQNLQSEPALKSQREHPTTSNLGNSSEFTTTSIQLSKNLASVKAKLEKSNKKSQLLNNPLRVNRGMLRLSNQASGVKPSLSSSAVANDMTNMVNSLQNNHKSKQIIDQKLKKLRESSSKTGNITKYLTNSQKQEIEEQFSSS